jgi:hypothetical protein
VDLPGGVIAREKMKKIKILKINTEVCGPSWRVNNRPITFNFLILIFSIPVCAWTFPEGKH